MTAIIVGVILQLLRPIPFAPRSARLFGGLIAILAVALFIWSIRKFKSAGTPVPGNRPTTTIVKAGPYRFSRNPIYLAFSLFQIGIALVIDSAWLLVTLLAAIALMSLVVIPREESYLTARFGEDYKSYRASVRRWL